MSNTTKAKLTLDFKVVYDHLQRVRDEDKSFYELYIKKVHYLMMIQVLLFTSMAFALARIEWIAGGSAWHLVVLTLLATVGSASLAVGFCYCIKCLGIAEVAVVGVTRLAELVETGEIKKLSTDDLYEDLSQNVAGIICKDRDLRDRQRAWGIRINHLTITGFVQVAAFVVYAVIGNVVITSVE